MTEEIIIEDAFCPFDEDIAREIFNKMDKQLQRLKQENNSLEAELQNITVQSNNEITALKQENKKLKELNTSICEDWTKQIEYYWEVLEKIRSLCNKGAGVYTNAKILGLINEVLGDENN